MEPFPFDIETFYESNADFSAPLCHFLYFHMGLNRVLRQGTKDQVTTAKPETADKATQTDKSSIFWSYFS